VNKYIRETFNPFALIKNASFPEYIIDQCSEFVEGKYENLGTVAGVREMMSWKIQSEDAYKILNNQP
jgi:hypothetical protein